MGGRHLVSGWLKVCATVQASADVLAQHWLSWRVQNARHEPDMNMQYTASAKRTLPCHCCSCRWLVIAIVAVARTPRYMHFSIGKPM